MKKIVLVVDDDRTSLKRASGILEKDYRVAAAVSGEMVFKYLENNTPELILLDLFMPDMDGFEVLKKLRDDDRYKQIPVIFLSGEQDPAKEAECLSVGALDYITKPYVPTVLKSRVDRAMELSEYHRLLVNKMEKQAENIDHQKEQITDIQNAVIVGLANIIEERDSNTGNHVMNTQAYVEMLCNELMRRGLYEEELTPEFKALMIKAAPLHDIGKIKITDFILKKPGRLSDEEYRVIQKHTYYGAEIIDEILGGIEDREYLKLTREVALYHHERWDGNGYPEGLRGEEIPLGARIMAIADVFDALYSDRVYRKGIRPVDAVFAIIEESSGTQFDPTVGEAFLSLRNQIKKYIGEEEEHE